MKRVWISAAVVVAVVVGVMANVQVVSADPAIVIKNDGQCGMPGSDEDGEIIFGGVGTQTTKLENGNKVMLKCKGTGITNESGRGQSFSGFNCGIFSPSGDFIIADDTHATVSASGVGTLTCSFRKPDTSR